MDGLDTDILSSNLQSSVYESLDKHTALLVAKDNHEATLMWHSAAYYVFSKILAQKGILDKNLALEEIDSYVFVLPDFRAKYGDDLNSFRDELLELLGTLRRFHKSKQEFKILISPYHTLLYPMPKSDLLENITLSIKQSYNLDALKEQLSLYGYEPTQIVELEGEMSARGDILDIFVPGSEYPYRISFFDDEIESIREFNTQNQLSNKMEIEHIDIFPALFSFQNDTYKQVDALIKSSSFQVFSKDMASLGLWYLGEHGVYLHSLFTHRFISQDALLGVKDTYCLEENLPLDVDTFSAFVPLSNKIYHDLSHININTKSTIHTFIQSNKSKSITIFNNNEAGFKALDISSGENLSTITMPFVINIANEHEVIISLNTLSKAKSKHKKVRLKINELNIGEYVIHTEYGIGIFKGIFAEKIMGVIRDFIRIDYAGEDRLLLPVENLNMIERFVSDDVPILDRLGKGSFAKIKEKVREKLFAIANEIVRLAAKRSLLQGQKISINAIDTSLKLAQFSKACDFELTIDQKRSIEEIYKDMSSGKVMDRLLSGDVGFGKTEVAMNAIYAAFLNGFQSALVVPTTLLSSQHFKSLYTRLSTFGLKIARLDRFVSSKSKILQALKNGEIDVIVGTHSLLGAEFKNLGIIVVDEEHKFGVKQKEKIKELSANTHLLSMSATPIPRTLNMALSNLKSLSSLRTPPSERLPVRTFVKVIDKPLLKEIILREIRRGGGVFYVHNNIATIEKKKATLQELLPNIKISILHSQIPSQKAEEIVLDFYEGRSDVLLATSIIESGIHLPNANTIIIENADRFGIADLHQLRGRVGRENKEGFCYFLIKDIQSLSDESKKRLLALEKNSYLGSGENLAYHDLEIRGGGNLLGITQSGHIKNIGYGLYLKMLEECINTLTQKESFKPKDAEIKIHINAYLSSDLIPNDSLRLELYRRLCFCQSQKEVYDIEGEIEDRFGKIDASTMAFLELMRIKILATKADIKLLSSYEKNIQIVFNNGEKRVLSAPTRDKDDVMETIFSELNKLVKETHAMQLL